MRYLQPAMLPKYIEPHVVTKELDSDPHTYIKEIRNPFPEPIRELRTKTLTISDQKKAEMKAPNINVNLRNNQFSLSSRHYSSMSPFLTVSKRSYSKKAKKEEKCDQKPRCIKNKACPSFVVPCCEHAKGSDCVKKYIDPCCTKKLAPYPSYSETCAERLPDDPSECMQCPWKKCGGAEAIKPPKRNYHTATLATAKYEPLVPLVSQICDARKEPCKRPPPKCKKDDKKEKEKCPEKKKKKCNWNTAYGLWCAKNTIAVEPCIDFGIEPIELSSGCCKKFPYDKNQADYNEVSKRKCTVKKNPKCIRRKKKLVPDCDSGECKTRCSSYFQQPTALWCEKKCPVPPGKCPPKGWIKGPVKDTRIDERYKPQDPCCEEAKKVTRRSPKIKPKVYVPDPPDYDHREL